MPGSGPAAPHHILLQAEHRRRNRRSGRGSAASLRLRALGVRSRHRGGQVRRHLLRPHDAHGHGRLRRLRSQRALRLRVRPAENQGRKPFARLLRGDRQHPRPALCDIRAGQGQRHRLPVQRLPGDMECGQTRGACPQIHRRDHQQLALERHARRRRISRTHNEPRGHLPVERELLHSSEGRQIPHHLHPEHVRRGAGRHRHGAFQPLRRQRLQADRRGPLRDGGRWQHFLGQGRRKPETHVPQGPAQI